MRTRFPQLVLAALLGGAVLLVGASTARADAYQKCQEKLGHAQSKLDRDNYRHGPNSWQVRHDFEHLQDARAWCEAHRAYGYDRFGRDNRYDRYYERDRGYDGYRDRDGGFYR